MSAKIESELFTRKYVTKNLQTSFPSLERKKERKIRNPERNSTFFYYNSQFNLCRYRFRHFFLFPNDTLNLFIASL